MVEYLLVGFGAAVCLRVAYQLGRWRGRRLEISARPEENVVAGELRDMKKELTEALSAARSVSSMLAQAQTLVREQRAAITKIEAERDEFKRIAATPKRSVNHADELVTKLWDTRPYRATLDANLKRLSEDMLATVAKTDRITLVFRLSAQTGWWHSTLAREQPKMAEEGVIMKDWHFTGTYDQVMDELSNALKSPLPRSCFPLVKSNSDLSWRAPFDPINFTCTLSRRTPAGATDFPVIEVLRTETKVLEIERPVFIEREVEVVREVVKDPADLDALIAARVETELASRLDINRLKARQRV